MEIVMKITEVKGRVLERVVEMGQGAKRGSISNLMHADDAVLMGCNLSDLGRSGVSFAEACAI